MDQQKPDLLLILLSEKKRTKPTGIIWNSVTGRRSTGCLRVMEHMNASSRSALSSFLNLNISLTDDDLSRLAIPIPWQSKIFLEDMQLRICLLGIQPKTTFGRCKISPSLASCKKLIRFLLALVVLMTLSFILLGRRLYLH